MRRTAPRLFAKEGVRVLPVQITSHSLLLSNFRVSSWGVPLLPIEP